jgi:adenine-specific DNA-methyltransferase
MNEIHINDNVIVLDKFIKDKNNFKMIYIDPPYNTRSNFSYEDKKTSDDWIRMMKIRLEKAKDLLSEDGSIFISIDDNEVYNLKNLCDSIFGKENFVGNLITKQAQRSNAKHLNTIHEYILVYAKNKTKLHEFKIARVVDPSSSKIINRMYNSIKFHGSIKEKEKKLKETSNRIMQEYGITWIRNYSNVSIDNKIFFAKDLSTPGLPREVHIPEINLYLEPLKSRGWSSDKKFIELHKNNLLHFKDKRPYEIHYLENSVDNVVSILDFYSRQGTEDLKKLNLDDLFDTPKPVELIKYLIRIGTKEANDRVLDFFAGSGTTGQAVIEINKEDNKNLEFVLVQIEESINPKSKAFVASQKLDLQPVISELMIHRIKHFIDMNNYTIYYKIYKYEKET